MQTHETEDFVDRWELTHAVLHHETWCGWMVDRERVANGIPSCGIYLPGVLADG